MNSSWIPTWAGVLWTLIFLVVLFAHARHMVAMGGRKRFWHATHVLMALGMIDMFLPRDSMLVSGVLPEVVFGLAALALLGLIASDAVKGKGVAALWPIAAVDMAAMVYMFIMTKYSNQVLTLILVIWFVAEALGWATGVLSTAAGRGGLDVLRKPLRRRSLAPVGGASGESATEASAAPGTADLRESVHGAPMRITLALMSVGMVYMFLAMQYGMPAMAPMMHGGGM